METNVAESPVECPQSLALEMRRMKACFPFRIVWGYVDEAGSNHVDANYDKRRMNKAVREGKTVFSVG